MQAVTPDPQVTTMGWSREIPEETPNTPYCYCLANFSEFLYMIPKKYSISKRSEMLNYQCSLALLLIFVLKKKLLLSFLPRTQQKYLFQILK